MMEKTCRCGATKKNFKFDIGKFFVDECCLKAGFDELGQKPGEAIGLTEEQAAEVTAPEAGAELEVVDDGNVDQQESEAEILERKEKEAAAKKAEKERKKAEKQAAKEAAAKANAGT